jgi:hypothetical protein
MQWILNTPHSLLTVVWCCISPHWDDFDDY